MTRWWQKLCLVAALSLAMPALATTVVSLPEEVLFGSASEILLVHVIERETVEMPIAPGVFTDFTLLVEQRVAGSLLPGTTLTVRIPGGVSETRAVHVEGMPSFVPGETVLVFLEPLPAFPDGTVAYIPLGLNQGVWRVDTNALYRATWQDGLIGQQAPLVEAGVALETIRERVAAARRGTP